MQEKWKLQHITLNETVNKKFEVAVLPIGATEPHNYHLPYGSDAFHSDYVATKSCKAAYENGASVLQLPTIPYGVDANMMEFPFAMNVYQKTLNLFVKDIVDSLIFNNVKKIVILNGHGGNEFRSFLRDLYPDIKAFVCLIDWWKVASDHYDQIFEYPDDHSGEMETSVISWIYPELVHIENAKDGKFNRSQFDAINNGWVTIARKWINLTESSGVGYPFKATKEKGEKYLDVTIERISRFLVELSNKPFTDKFPF
jgi:creatinine amidohydrolase